MGFLDKLSTFVHESSLSSTAYNDPMYRQLQGFTARDTQIGGYSTFGREPQDQVNQQTEEVKNIRDLLFSRVDIIKGHHLAKSIKNSIVGDCFHALCDKRFVNIQYRTENDELSKLFNEEIEKLLKRTYFLEIFKLCLINDGMNYGEIFLSTKCRVGEGIVEISNDINVKRHLAIYKNLSPIGFIKFKSRNNEVTPEQYIDPSKMSHFVVNPEQVAIEISFDLDIDIELPEKIMCAEPLLTPVVDLIIQYNALEYVSTGVEITNALAPIILGVGVSPDSDMVEITRQLQEYSIALNSTRNNILNNLENIDAKAIAKEIGRIQLVPYSTQEGTNTMKEIVVHRGDNKLSEKLNDDAKKIEKAMGMPEGYLASTTVKGKKEESISMNPRYSRMLSGIQQSLARGIGDFIYKHLQYRFSKADSKGNVFVEREIDRNCIDIKFQSITNIDNRLDMEQMMLTAETMGNIAGVLDMIAGSPNLPVKTNGDQFMKLWRNLMEPIPALRDSLEIDHALEEHNNNITYGPDGEQDTYSFGDEEPNYSIKNQKEPKNTNATLTDTMDKEQDKIKNNIKDSKNKAEKDVKEIFH